MTRGLVASAHGSMVYCMLIVSHSSSRAISALNITASRMSQKRKIAWRCYRHISKDELHLLGKCERTLWALTPNSTLSTLRIGRPERLLLPPASAFSPSTAQSSSTPIARTQRVAPFSRCCLTRLLWGVTSSTHFTSAYREPDVSFRNRMPLGVASKNLWASAPSRKVTSALLSRQRISSSGPPK